MKFEQSGMRLIFVAAAFVAAFLTTPSAIAQNQPHLHVKDLRIGLSGRPLTPDAGTAVIVASTRSGQLGRMGETTTFVSLSAPLATTDANQPSVPALGPNRVSFAAQAGRGDRDPRVRRYRAFQVPPGRYVLSTFALIGIEASGVDGRQYCFGTLAFDIAAGDVLYLGEFIGADQLDPIIDYNLEDARGALAAAAPQLQTALRPVHYDENVEFDCNWAEMARLQLTRSERQRLTSAGALTALPPTPVAAPVQATAVSSPVIPAPTPDSTTPPAASTPSASPTSP
jgi:hypothetical protein